MNSQLVKGLPPQPEPAGSPYQQLQSVTSWVLISPMEFFLTCRAMDSSCKWDEINNCPLCMCPVFDEIEQESEQQLQQALVEHQTALMAKVVSG